MQRWPGCLKLAFVAPQGVFIKEGFMDSAILTQTGFLRAAREGEGALSLLQGGWSTVLHLPWAAGKMGASGGGVLRGLRGSAEAKCLHTTLGLFGESSKKQGN
jgi:hypothetical protein